MTSIRDTAPPAIDPRSMHLFEDEANHYLYDVTSGSFGTISDDLAKLLRECTRYDWETIARGDFGLRPELDFDVARDALELMRSNGLFRHVPLDAREQRASLEMLYHHRPRRLQLLFAQMCNLKCIYCYEEANGSNARKRLMKLEMAQKCVEYLAHVSGGRTDLQITFFGGEPLLNFRVMQQVVDYCAEVQRRTGKSFVFETITNGTLLTPEIVHYFIENRFALMISLDGTREMNNHNRPSVNGKDCYDTILANARYADQAYKAARVGIPVKVRANLTHEFHDYTGTVRFLESQGFTTIGIGTVDDLPWSDGKLHALSADDLESVVAQRHALLEIAYAKAKAGGRMTVFEAKVLREALAEVAKTRITRGLRCGVGRNTNIVDCEGNIYPCHRYGDMEKYILGNVQDMALNRAQTMSYYLGVNAASSGKCQQCWARYVCGGPCAWEVSNPNGTVLEPDEAACNRIRQGLEQSLKFRSRVEREAPHLLPNRSGCGDCSCGTQGD